MQECVWPASRGAVSKWGVRAVEKAPAKNLLSCHVSHQRSLPSVDFLAEEQLISAENRHYSCYSKERRCRDSQLGRQNWSEAARPLSWDPRTIPAGSRRSLVQPPAPSRVSCELRSRRSGFHPVWTAKPLRMETAHPVPLLDCHHETPFTQPEPLVSVLPIASCLPTKPHCEKPGVILRIPR